jgi:hypothetical protein
LRSTSGSVAQSAYNFAFIHELYSAIETQYWLVIMRGPPGVEILSEANPRSGVGLDDWLVPACGLLRT